MSDDPVLFDVKHSARGASFGIATLNSEKTLNALSLPMIRALGQQLREWEKDRNIAVVVIQGAGERAFSAGGDIQQLYHSMVEAKGGENHYAREFFEEEYRLDYFLHRYDKPIVAWANGFVMGGGLGVMGACSHRIGTENSRVALPEITIGLFPDAGATWFLANMPVHLAHFIAWTGCQLNAADAQKVGLIDRVMQSSDKSRMMKSLLANSWNIRDNNYAKLDQLLPKLTPKAARLPDSELAKHEIDIASVVGSCMSTDRPAIAFDELLDSMDMESEWLARAAATFRAGSTTTAHLIPEQIKRAKGLDLKDMFKLELNIALQCSRKPDFVEGVRARLIDRDNEPKWHYPTLGEVPEDWIDEHFTLPLEGRHPLEDLPAPA